MYYSDQGGIFLSNKSYFKLSEKGCSDTPLFYYLFTATHISLHLINRN